MDCVVWRSRFDCAFDVSAQCTLFVLPRSKEEGGEEEGDQAGEAMEESKQEEDGDAVEVEPSKASGQAQKLLAAVQTIHSLEHTLVALYTASSEEEAVDPVDHILSLMADSGATKLVESLRERLVGAVAVSPSMNRAQCGEVIAEAVRLSKVTIPSGIHDLAGRKFMHFEQGTRGREIAEVEQWAGERESALCVILGERGVGKSSLASEICRRSARSQTRINVVGSCFFGEQIGSSAVRDCVNRLSAQLSASFGEAFKVDAAPGKICARNPSISQLFEALVVRPLQALKVAKDAKYVWVLDGVSNIEEHEQKVLFGLIIDFLISRKHPESAAPRPLLPRWFSILMTGEEPAFTLLNLPQEETRAHVLRLDTSSHENQMDIAMIARRQVAQQQLSSGKESPIDYEAELAQQTLSSSGAVFFYARMMAQVAANALGMRQGDIMEKCLAAARQHLDDILYDSLFQVLAVAREPVPVAVVAQSCGMSVDQVVSLVIGLPMTVVDVHVREGEGEEEWLWLGHSLYKEWLLRKEVKLELAELQVDVDAGHGKIADWCRSNAKDRFSQRNVLVHMAQTAHLLDDAVAAFFDLKFVLAQAQTFSLDHLIADGEILLTQLHLSDKPLATVDGVRVLINALRLSASLLPSSERLAELPSQLLGRIKDADHPIVQQARSYSPLRPWLRPLSQSLKFADKALINSVYYGSDRLRGVHLDRAGHHAVTSHVNARELRLWNVVDGSFIGRLSYTTCVTASCMRGDGGGVVVGLDDGRLVMTDVVSRQEVVQTAAHQGFITAVDVLNDGSYILSCSTDGTVKLWVVNLATREIALAASHHFSPLELTASCAILEKGAGEQGESYAGKIVVGFKENRCLVFDAKLSKTLATLEGHSSVVTHLAYDPRLIASASIDKTCRIWDLKSGKCLHVCTGHSRGVTAVRFISEGTELLSVSLDKSMRLWSTLSGECTRVVFFHTSAVIALDVAFHFLQREGFVSVLTATEDGELQLWEVPELVSEAKSMGGKSMISRMSLNSVTSLKGLNRSIKSFKHVKSGLLKLMTRTYRNTETIAFDDQPTHHSHHENITGWAFSGDGRMASGARDGTICLWDIESGKLLASFQAHSKPINSLAFSPDGSRLLSSSQDGSLKVFELSAKQAILELQMPGEYVSDSSFLLLI